MNEHIQSFFNRSPDDSSTGHFHCVIALHDQPNISWEELHQMAPSLPRGWYELAQLSESDRTDFVHDYWVSTLPFQPRFTDFIRDFFASLEAIGVYVTQQKFGDPFETHLVYGLEEDRGFFRGSPPLLIEAEATLETQFSNLVLPADYLAFLRIHDGFYKYTDTGITPSSDLALSIQRFRELLTAAGTLLGPGAKPIDPNTLFPFYESFGFPCYQCFWQDWYPDQEMGNVYYCGLTHTLSDYQGLEPSPEHMAFPTFLDWLMFYMEIIEV